MKSPAIAASLGLALLLGGCAAFSPKEGKDNNCPETGFLNEAQMASYPVPDKTLADNGLLARAALIDYRGNCLSKNGKTTVDLTVTLAAEKGAQGGTAEKMTFAWFAALTDENGKIEQKQIFETEVAFDNEGHGQTSEEIEFLLPQPSAEDAQRRRIVLGLQLSKEQLDFNRKGTAP